MRPNQHVSAKQTSAAAVHLDRVVDHSSRLAKQPRSQHVSRADSLDTSHTVNYSFFNKLDWSENKRDWQKYVKIKDVEITDILTSCAMLQPQLPMNVTPSRDQLQYMFQSVGDMERVLATCTKDSDVRGFAIACKSWRSIVSSKTDQRPKGHICDILTVSEEGRIHFWVIVAHWDKSNIMQTMGYLMTTGRMIKYQLVQNWSHGVPTVFIQCGLSSTGARTQETLEVESATMQTHLHQFYSKSTVDFKTLQRALAMVILSRESPITRCAADEASILLSAKQAEVLMHRGKVNYIEGSAGCGKSWIAVELYRMHGGDSSVYICTTKSFLQFLTSTR